VEWQGTLKLTIWRFCNSGAQFRLGNILIQPQENSNSMMRTCIPKFEIQEVTLIVDEANTLVIAHGQSPLFKSHKFEKALKQWLHEETKRVLVPQIK